MGSLRILGLTGSVAMGKSTTAAMLRRMKVPVYDADAAVHALMGPGGAAVAAIQAAFPGVADRGFVDRKALGAIVFDDPPALAALERILHPMVRRRERKFLRDTARTGAPLAVLDIPLMFETGADRRCDAVMVVTAPPFLQRQRALARPGMTDRRLAAVLARQMPDLAKRHRADFVVQTGLGRAHALRAVRRAVMMTLDGPAAHWPPPVDPMARDFEVWHA